MLIHDLGFRALAPAEEQEILAKVAVVHASPTKQALIPAAVLSPDPLISYSGIVPQAPLGLASVCGTSLGAQDSWFLISPTWSIETDEAAQALHELAVQHR